MMPDQKRRRRLVFADHLADVDGRLARARERVTELEQEREQLIQAERDRLSSGVADLARATGGGS